MNNISVSQNIQSANTIFQIIVVLYLKRSPHTGVFSFVVVPAGLAGVLGCVCLPFFPPAVSQSVMGGTSAVGGLGAGLDMVVGGCFDVLMILRRQSRCHRNDTETMYAKFFSVVFSTMYANP